MPRFCRRLCPGFADRRGQANDPGGCLQGIGLGDDQAPIAAGEFEDIKRAIEGGLARNLQLYDAAGLDVARRPSKHCAKRRTSAAGSNDCKSCGPRLNLDRAAAFIQVTARRV